MDHSKLWEILKEMGIPDHPTCLLRYLYAGQEATIRTGHGTTDWFQTGKERKENEVAQSCPTLCSSLHQAPPSMGFSRQEYWSGLPFPSPLIIDEQNWFNFPFIVPTFASINHVLFYFLKCYFKSLCSLFQKI